MVAEVEYGSVMPPYSQSMIHILPSASMMKFSESRSFWQAT